MSLKQLQEKRGSLVKEADLLIRSASNEKRSVSQSENLRLDSIKSEILDLDFQIEKEKRSMQSDISRSNRESALPTEGYSLCRAIGRASAGNLDGLEGELSQEIAQRSGKAPSGFYVPQAVLAEKRAMSVTGSSGAYGGNAVATEVYTSFIEALRPKLRVAQMGATIMSGLTSNISIPRHAAASTAAWRAENAELGESTQTIEQLLLSPKRIGSYTKLSKQLIVQSSPDVEAFVRNDLMSAIAVGFDLAAINGTGADGQPTGILATSGIGSVAGGTNGLAPTFAILNSLVAAVANANAAGERPGFLFNTKTESKLRSTRKLDATDSVMLLNEGQTTIAGQPWMTSNNIPSNLTKGTSTGVCSAIIFGNWEDVILASFGMGIEVLADPFTLATQGMTRIVVSALADVGIRRAASFAAMLDALTA